MPKDAHTKAAEHHDSAAKSHRLAADQHGSTQRGVRNPPVRSRLCHADPLYKGQLKLKDWAFAIAKRSTMRKARIALARRLAIIMHAMLRDGTELVSN